MRIAMVGHKRVPSREGGIEVVVEELAARMVMHGHSVTCYNRTGHHVSGKEYDIEHLDEYRGIRLKRVPTIDRKGLAAVDCSSAMTLELLVAMLFWASTAELSSSLACRARSSMPILVRDI